MREVHRGEARAGQPEVHAQRDRVSAQLVQKQTDRGGEQRGVGKGCRLVQSHTLADCAQGPSVRRVEDSPTQLGKAQVEDVRLGVKVAFAVGQGKYKIRGGSQGAGANDIGYC